MRIKIFAAPGDNRDDFAQVQNQANQWFAEFKGKVVGMETNMAVMPESKSTIGKFLLALTILYEEA